MGEGPFGTAAFHVDIKPSRCPRCGHGYYGLDNYCESCGARLPVPDAGWLSRCSRCGRDSGGKFCAFCGGAIERVPTPPLSASKPWSSLTLRWGAPYCHGCGVHGTISDTYYFCTKCGTRKWEQRAKYYQCSGCRHRTDWAADADPHAPKYCSYCGGRYTSHFRVRDFDPDASGVEHWQEA